MLEFVVEKGIFYLVHASNAQRSSHAAIRIAVDMAKNKLISEQEAIMRLEPFHLKHPVERVIDPRLGKYIIPLYTD
ncbi:hypothetical protein EON65_15740 [archaeon]|nr:MAG: hypothetical protein EON65_15740 [archaeon]